MGEVARRSEAKALFLQENQGHRNSPEDATLATDWGIFDKCNPYFLRGAGRNTPFGTCLAAIHRRASHSLLGHSFTCRNRKALVMTETELKLMAAPAITGLINSA